MGVEKAMFSDKFLNVGKETRERHNELGNGLPFGSYTLKKIC